MRGLKFACALFSFGATLAFAQAPQITLATTAWEPYVSDDPAYHGYVYEIVKSAYEAAGYKVQIQFMPWEKALNALELGLVDGIFPEYFSASQEKSLAYTKPFSGGPIGFYKLSNAEVSFPSKNPTADLAKTLEKMKRYRFGVVKGYTNVPAFDHATQLKKHYVNNDKENIEQLYHGKVDAIVIDKFTADYMLKHDFPWNYQIKISFMPPALGYEEFHVVIRKTSPHYQTFVDAFNRGLDKINRNGLLSEIIDKDASVTGEQVA